MDAVKASGGMPKALGDILRVFGVILGALGVVLRALLARMALFWPFLGDLSYMYMFRIARRSFAAYIEAFCPPRITRPFGLRLLCNQLPHLAALGLVLCLYIRLRGRRTQLDRYVIDMAAFYILAIGCDVALYIFAFDFMFGIGCWTLLYIITVPFFSERFHARVLKVFLCAHRSIGRFIGNEFLVDLCTIVVFSQFTSRCSHQQQQQQQYRLGQPGNWDCPTHT